MSEENRTRIEDGKTINRFDDFDDLGDNPTIEQKVQAIIMNYGGVDGAHHKQYALDLILRVVTNCPMIVVESKCNGKTYYYEHFGESPEYLKWCEDYRGEYDPEEKEYQYGEWDKGIAP